MPERIPSSTEKKCPTCGSVNVYQVPGGVDTTFALHPDLEAPVEHLWACEKCQQTFRLVRA
jgi:ribosomal protein L37AE/L43A